jgi:hypothetical protein
MLLVLLVLVSLSILLLLEGVVEVLIGAAAEAVVVLELIFRGIH